jgi:hypothetical protein
MPPKLKRVLPGKRYPLNMRTTKELRDKVDGAAMASGRSLVQEVEFRLQRSFDLEQHGVELVRLPERLRRCLEQGAEVNGWSISTEIVDRLDTLFQKEALEKEAGSAIEQAVHDAATKTATKLEQELRQRGLIPRPNDDDSGGKQ